MTAVQKGVLVRKKTKAADRIAWIPVPFTRFRSATPRTQSRAARLLRQHADFNPLQRASVFLIGWRLRG